MTCSCVAVVCAVLPLQQPGHTTAVRPPLEGQRVNCPSHKHTHLAANALAIMGLQLVKALVKHLQQCRRRGRSECVGVVSSWAASRQSSSRNWRKQLQ